MKKLIAVLFMILMLPAASAFAEDVKVLIPDYKVILNDNEIDYKNSLYPLISYKDITYFPMTYEYCRFMGMTTSWVEGEGLEVRLTKSCSSALYICS